MVIFNACHGHIHTYSGRTSHEKETIFMAECRG